MVGGTVTPTDPIIELIVWGCILASVIGLLLSLAGYLIGRARAAWSAYLDRRR